MNELTSTQRAMARILAMSVDTYHKTTEAQVAANGHSDLLVAGRRMNAELEEARLARR